ncbi:hypothetical protein PRIPAC_80216, partial [Pristionchus pacificus]|uniref:Uncharacterized protein n=1 Tax=Pristionchus pacificus TaxID=54126 RepID=A0A2A6BWL2_PRIPA
NNAVGCFGPLGRRHPTASRRVDLVSTTPLASGETREIGKEEDEMISLVFCLKKASHEPRERLCKVRNERERSPRFAHSLARCLRFRASWHTANCSYLSSNEN